VTRTIIIGYVCTTTMSTDERHSLYSCAVKSIQNVQRLHTALHKVKQQH